MIPPATEKQINAKVARLTAFLTVVLLLAGLFSGLCWISLLLAFDFFMRGFTGSVSPLSRAARALSKIYFPKPKMANARPKIFAARIGFVFSAAIALATFSGLTSIAHALAELLVLATGLEAFLGICVAGGILSLLDNSKYKTS